MYRNSVIYISLVVIILSAVMIPTGLFDRMIKSDTDRYREIMHEIKAMTEKGSDKALIDNKCRALKEDWDRNISGWSVCLNHTLIEKIDLELCAFIESALAFDIQGAGISYEKLNRIFDTAVNQDALTFTNIL